MVSDEPWIWGLAPRSQRPNMAGSSGGQSYIGEPATSAARGLPVSGGNDPDRAHVTLPEPVTGLQAPRSVPVDLLRRFAESLGFDPDEVESVSFDLFTVTVTIVGDDGQITLTIPVQSGDGWPSDVVTPAHHRA